jgi:hypothetical protein
MEAEMASSGTFGYALHCFPGFLFESLINTPYIPVLV